MRCYMSDGLQEGICGSCHHCQDSFALVPYSESRALLP